MKLTLLLPLKLLLVEVIRYSPVSMFIVLLLMLLTSAISGVGILLIIPLLAAAGIDVGTSLSFGGGISEQLVNTANIFNISMTLPRVLGLYILLVVVMAILSYGNSVQSVRLQSSFTTHLRQQLYRDLFYAEWQYLNREHMSDFMRLVTSQVQSVSSCVQTLLGLLSHIILVIIYVLFSLVIAPELTALAVVFTVILLITSLCIHNKILASGSQELSANRQIFRSIFNQLTSLKVIKSYAAESVYLEKVGDASQDLEQQHIVRTHYEALTRCINWIGSALIFAILLYVSLVWLAVPLANLLVVMLIFARLMPQLTQIQSRLQRLIHLSPQYTDLLKKRAELVLNQELNASEVDTPVLTKALSLHHVSYQYPESSSPVFQPISACIQHYTTVAVTGPSGAGKSTLADLLSGLISPSSGSICVDNIEVNENNRHQWRQRVAYVPQDTFFFHDTVRKNLVWVTDKDIDEQRLWQVLRLAVADEFVAALPQGLDTMVGDRGVKLSGGQKQRLALARALLLQPDVLILDEATSALDSDNESKIQQALVQLDGNLTIIIIAHNEASIAHVTQRIELG